MSWLLHLAGYSAACAVSFHLGYGVAVRRFQRYRLEVEKILEESHQEFHTALRDLKFQVQVLDPNPAKDVSTPATQGRRHGV